jgi:lipoate-protein ligase A
MKYVDLTLPTPEQNLACDEALFQLAENGSAGETLRFWEPARFFVVLGCSRPRAADVHLASCRKENIPVVRRFSGGGTVLQGPGCLNFSLVLDLERSPELGGITGTNRYVMNRHRHASERLAGRPVEVLGHTDLALDRLKFSGNAQRRGKRFALFHGTFLLSFDIARVGLCLPVPERQPDYREDRPHDRFLTNLNLPSAVVKKELLAAWDALEPLNGGLPAGEIDRLAEHRYASDEWNSKF